MDWRKKDSMNLRFVDDPAGGGERKKLIAFLSLIKCKLVAQTSNIESVAGKVNTFLRWFCGYTEITYSRGVSFQRVSRNGRFVMKIDSNFKFFGTDLA